MNLRRFSASLSLRALCVLMCAGLCSTASAHPTPGTVALLDFTVDGARLEQDVPIEELERALHRTLMLEVEPAQVMVSRQHDLLRRYAAMHVQMSNAGTAAPWQTRVLSVSGRDASDGPRATFVIELEAPHGVAHGDVVLHDDIVSHEVVSHYTRVYVRSDWATGRASTDPTLAGIIHAGHNDVSVARRGSFWRGFYSTIALGIEHIATGADHLMFLLALVLVAPVAAGRRARRWELRRTSAEAMRELVRVVSAFTLGHCATLALGALGFIAPSPVLIEATIAVSVLFAALHALRPIVERREALIALSFGLVHGLAFATTLVSRDLGRAQLVWTLLGFNTGIELAQLALLFCVVPWLLLLARTQVYPAFRCLWASVCGLAAIGWLIERTTPVANPFAQPVDWLQAHPLALLVGLATTTFVAMLFEPKRRSSRLRIEGT
jgi:hypothetical protein